VTALSSISHNGGESFGIDSLLRREKFVQPDGSVQEVPVVSGNSMRGVLRDRGMLHMCRELGYGSEEEGAVRGLPIGAFHFLFSGGSLGQDGGKTINIESARKLRSMIPLVSIFGGAMGNNILPGKLDMGKLIPICAETAHLLPAEFLPSARPASIWEYTQREMYTRKDDERNEHLRGVIESRTRNLIEAARLEKSARVARSEPVEDSGQRQQMMYYVETLASGTPFYWAICLRDVSDMEFEAFLTALAEFSKRPVIGGKANVGHGHVAIEFGSWYSLDSRIADAGGQAIASPAGEVYRSHLAARRAEIRAVLEAM